MANHHVTVYAHEVQVGDRFTIGNRTYVVGLTGKGTDPYLNRPYILIAGGLELNPNTDVITMDMDVNTQFTILKR